MFLMGTALDGDGAWCALSKVRMGMVRMGMVRRACGANCASCQLHIVPAE